MALSSTDWLLSTGWRQGLFTHCIEDLNQPIPFNYDAKETGCYPSRDVCEWPFQNKNPCLIFLGIMHFMAQTVYYYLFAVYIKATAGLCILSLVTDIIATILTGCGLRTKNQNIKYKFYRRAVLIMLVACKYNVSPQLKL